MSRTNFNSSTLVRLLAQATGAGVGAPRTDLAEQLSQWLSAFDAVALHGILQSVPAHRVAPGASAAPADATQTALAEALQRTRASLTATITRRGEAPTGVARKTRTPPPRRPVVPVPPVTEATPAEDYGSYFKRHLALQREMALKIAPLRQQARQVLARSAPGLRPLAALDALMEQALGEREHRLLGQVPALLEKRYEQLRTGPGLSSFDGEWEAIVLAEMHLRLQPVVGMMEAWGASPQTRQ